MMPSSISSDGELVARSLRGESAAFGDLYNRYFPAVYDFLHRTMRNGDEAADVAQETFLRAMESLASLANPAAFKSWLFSIAHHQALNRLERQKRFVMPPALEWRRRGATRCCARSTPTGSPTRSRQRR